MIWLLIYLVIIVSNELNPVVTEYLLEVEKLNISFIFITPSYFSVPKNIRLNSAHYFIMEILNKWELQQITFNHLSYIDV